MKQTKKFPSINLYNFKIIALFAVIVTILLSVALTESTPPLPDGETPIRLYTNQDDLQDFYLKAISEAEQSITLLIYSLRDTKIIQALRDKAEDGVSVLVVYDGEASRGVSQKLGPHVKKHKRNSKGLMHLKILNIDGKHTWIGSANFSKSSFHMHDNLVAGFHYEPLAELVHYKTQSLLNTGKAPEAAPVRFRVDDQNLEIYFLPDVRFGVERILHLINQAEESIRVSMYTFTRKDLLNALVQAHARGVRVQVILDGSQSRGASKDILIRFVSSNIPVFLSNGEGLNHHKTMIIDDNVLVSGSANWTRNAFTKNDDCFYVLSPLKDDQRIALNNMWGDMKRRAIQPR